MTTHSAPETSASARQGPPAGPDVLARLRDWEAKAEHAGRETVEARLDAWQARVETLRLQVHLAGLDARDDAAAPLARLEARLDHARDRLRELARESSDVWTVLAEAYESAREELATGERLVAEPVSTDSQ